MVRGLLNSYSGYVEAHTDFRGLHDKEHKRIQRLEEPCVQRLVLLREPYAQFLSELDHFPDEFALTRNGTVQVHDNHFVCSHQGLMGLCGSAAADGQCDPHAIVSLLDRSFDHVGFVEGLESTFDTLSDFMRCQRDSGRLPQANLTVFENALARARRIFWRVNATDAQLYAPRLYGSNITARLDALYQRRRDNASREAAALRLHRAPSRAEFEATQQCSIAVYRLAWNRFHASGGITSRSTQVWYSGRPRYAEAHAATGPLRRPERCILSGARHGDSYVRT